MGPFHFPEAWVDANHMLGVSKEYMVKPNPNTNPCAHPNPTPNLNLNPQDKGTPLYIATDEHEREFFKPLREYYDVKFLDVFIRVEKVFYP